jgi:hypothetical protein
MIKKEVSNSRDFITVHSHLIPVMSFYFNQLLKVYHFFLEF